VEGWNDFAVAQVGASAALAGLVFVGISVNLTRVLSAPGVPGRAGEAMIVLAALLFAASALLVPGQTPVLVGLELAALGLIDWIVVVALQWRVRALEFAQRPGSFTLRIVLGQLATLPFVLAGVGLAWRGEGSLYWFALAAFGSYAVAFVGAWVLLVEINR
jgi:modulator of FtsH protease